MPLAKPLSAGAQDLNHQKTAISTGEERLSISLAVAQSTVSRLLSLLEGPAEIQALQAQDKLSERHLRALDTIGDPEKRIDLASEAADKSWSVKETERRVNSALKSRAPKACVFRTRPITHSGATRSTFRL